MTPLNYTLIAQNGIMSSIGPTVKKFSITEEEIKELQEDGETYSEVINHILAETAAEWEQGFYSVLIIEDTFINTLKEQL